MSKVIGDHLLCEANTLVFQHVYAGTTYVVAVRIADVTIINYLPLTGVNATTCILAAINALTGGRTSKEKVTVKGVYVDLTQISIPSYTILEIIGAWTMAAGQNVSFIVNSDPTGGNTEIEVCGGKIDCNKANQADSISTIFLDNVAHAWVYRTHVIGGRRVVLGARGEGIELYECMNCIVYANRVEDGEYDCIKVRGGSIGCIVAENQCLPSTTAGVHGIQVAEAGTAYCIVANNRVATGLLTCGGIICHYADNNIIIGNQIQGLLTTRSVENGIELLDGANDNLVADNWIHHPLRGVYIRGTSPINNSIIGNHIYLSTDVVYAIYVSTGTDTTVYDNILVGTSSANNYGIYIDTGATRTRLWGNIFLGSFLPSLIVDLGTDTRLPSIIVPFIAGTEHIVADGSPKGFRIDAAGEYAIGYLVIPEDCQATFRIKIWGVGLAAPGAGNEMLLNIVANSGRPDETWNAEAISVANKPNNETAFAVNDVISWTLTITDDVDVRDLRPGDCVEIKVIYNAAVAPDIATNALLRCVQIEYV